MREEVEKRVLRVLVNSSIIFAIILALSFLNISFSSILIIIPAGGFTLTIAAALIIIVILFFMFLRVMLDLIRLIDLASETLLKRIPGFNPNKSPSVIRALKELAIVFAIAMVVSVASPLISSAPTIGGWLSLAVSIIAFAFSIILVYDAGRTLYAAFESSIQALIDRIVAHANSEGER